MWTKTDRENLLIFLFCKVKGLTLDYNNSQLIHLHQMLEWAKSESKNFQITVDYNRIRKHKDRRVTNVLTESAMLIFF